MNGNGLCGTGYGIYHSITYKLIIKMKLLILKRNHCDYDAVELGLRTSHPEYDKIIKIDPFVGCCLHCPYEYYTDFFLDSLIGNIIEINNDCFKKDGVYLPSELDIK